jgi:16S rRNA (cytidine1402-2'-O)-methyltransferase
MPARLLLVPVPLVQPGADAPLASMLPQAVIGRAAGLRHWVVENAKSTRAFLRAVDAVAPLGCTLRDIAMVELDKHGPSSAAADARVLQMLERARAEGFDVGLASEAGAPGVADPGAEVVAAAHRLGLEVEPLVGPSALLLALMASGLNGQNFAFVGYLPKEPGERARRLRALEAESRQWRRTQLFIETPYRNAVLLQALLADLAPSTKLAVAAGLTGPQARIAMRSIADWRAQGTPELGGLPAVYALLAAAA